MAIACFIFWLFTIDAFFFQFWGCGIRMHICILTRVQKGRVCSWKQGHILLINVLLKINFEHEGHLYANCLFWIFSLFVKCFFSILKWSHRHDGHLYAYCLLYTFTIRRKCFLFQFLGYGIGIQILILTEVQKKRVIGWKNGHNLLKNIIFQLNFQDEGNFYANCLFYILSFYVTCFFLKFLGCGIRMQIPIVKGVQNGRINTWRKNDNLLKR